MKPLRQIEAAGLMVSGKNYSIAFAASILGVTHRDQLVKPEKELGKSDQAPPSMLLAGVTDCLIGELATARRTYGADVLTLTVICRTVENLIQNVKVIKYLKQYHSEILNELEALAADVAAERNGAIEQRMPYPPER